jgi:hypothetical protein
MIRFEDACCRYALTAEELGSWQRAVDRDGLQGLKATKRRERLPPVVILATEGTCAEAGVPKAFDPRRYPKARREDRKVRRNAESPALRATLIPEMLGGRAATEIAIAH